jgi:isopenicillin N synthase-like dioxygenase
MAALFPNAGRSPFQSQEMIMKEASEKLHTIPVIDIGPFVTDNPADNPAGRAKVVREVKAACEGLGFLVVTGHGVPDRVIDDLYAQANQFFDLPLEEKT